MRPKRLPGPGRRPGIRPQPDAAFERAIVVTPRPAAQAVLSAAVLDGLVTVEKMGELQRYDTALVHERGAETQAGPEEEHAPALVAAERLHRRVVNDPRGDAKRRFEIEADPSLTEVPGCTAPRSTGLGMPRVATS